MNGLFLLNSFLDRSPEDKYRKKSSTIQIISGFIILREVTTFLICKPGNDWVPRQIASQKSLISFQKQLADMEIKLSTSKIRKILITGGCWSTERSRQIRRLLEVYTKALSEGGEGLNVETVVRRISKELGISMATVTINITYQDVVYKLDNRSGNARRCERYRERKRKT